MRILKTAALTTIALLSCLPQLALAEGNEHPTTAHGTESVHLSPGLTELLNQEMTAIEKGMMDLIPAISGGEWDTAAAIGKNIQASFILKQKLTAAQKEELHRVLPPLFIEMDQTFHKSAGMLAHAAEMKNADVVNFYFYKMNDACVACHAKFASKRFPGLATHSGEEGGHH
jgi:hypothetical protein